MLLSIRSGEHLNRVLAATAIGTPVYAQRPPLCLPQFNVVPNAELVRQVSSVFISLFDRLYCRVV